MGERQREISDRGTLTDNDRKHDRAMISYSRDPDLGQ